MQNLHPFLVYNSQILSSFANKSEKMTVSGYLNRIYNHELFLKYLDFS